MVSPTRPHQKELSDDRLPMICLNCGAKGAVPRDRLHGLLHCRGCGAFFRLEGCGGLVEVSPPALPPAKLRVAVRSCTSSWEAHDIPDPSQRATRPASLALTRGWGWRSITLAILTLLVLGVLAVAWARRSPPGQPELPRDLEARAKLWGEAWLKRDTSLLVRLTDPTEDRALRRWLAKTPAPDWGTQEGVRGGVTSDITIKPLPGQKAEVTIRIGRLDESNGQSGLMIPQLWAEKQGVWFFIPSRADSTYRRESVPAKPSGPSAGRGKKLPS